MLSYTFINSHSQVSDSGPKGPLVSLNFYFIFVQNMRRVRKPVSQMFNLSDIVLNYFLSFFQGHFSPTMERRRYPLKSSHVD